MTSTFDLMWCVFQYTFVEYVFVSQGHLNKVPICGLIRPQYSSIVVNLELRSQVEGLAIKSLQMQKQRIYAIVSQSNVKFNQVDVDDDHIDFLFLSNRSLLFCNIPLAIFRKQLPVYNFQKLSVYKIPQTTFSLQDSANNFQFTTFSNDFLL